MQFRALLPAALAVTLGASGVARADGPSDRTAAEALFNEAKRLMGLGQYGEACPKLAESQRLDPGVGTLLNLGLCYKSAGQSASAWSAYLEAAAAAHTAGQADRERLARGEAAAIESKLARLKLDVAPDAAAIANLAIKSNGSTVPRGLWGVPSPVDPGDLLVEASAPSKKTWARHARATEGEVTHVTVPNLEVDTAAAASPSPAGGATAATNGAADAAATSDAGTSGLGTQRIIAIGAAGVGVVGIAVGSVLGLSAKSIFKSADPYCDASGCTPEGIDKRHAAVQKANTATIVFAIGGVGLAAGAVLWLTAKPQDGSSPKEPGPAPAGAVGLVVGPSSLSLRATW